MYPTLSPSKVLWMLEWWEIYGLCEIIAERHNRVNGVKSEKPLNENHWREGVKEKSDYAKMMREKILAGEF